MVPAAVVAEDKVAADEPVAAKAEPSRGALGDAPFGEEVDEVEAERSFRRSGGGSGGGGGDKKKFFYTKKVCKFCTKQIDEKNINYKNIELMRKFVMPSGKIVPRRINGNCARHQRRVSEEIKKSRIIALLPFLDR
ncbi:MAG: 30S ribosomal protein S18 [Spirochaetes bacterium GWF1_51_8]|nr:MAG: 30S ribosomal protein S18 [Spirochaetes bacterium GWF1_51_8]